MAGAGLRQPASETRQTRPFGQVNFSGFDASNGLTVSVELPGDSRGYSLGSCPGSPTSAELGAEDFQFGFKFVQFGAEVLGQQTGP